MTIRSLLAVALVLIVAGSGRQRPQRFCDYTTKDETFNRYTRPSRTFKTIINTAQLGTDRQFISGPLAPGNPRSGVGVFNVQQSANFGVLVQPFFDRHYCYLMPLAQDSVPCIEALEDSVFQGAVPCPPQINGSGICDKWVSVGENANVTWLFDSQMGVPVQRVMVTGPEDSRVTWQNTYIDFKLSADPTLFDMAPWISKFLCTDLYSTPPAAALQAQVKDHDSVQVNDRARIDAINAQAETWKAGPNTAFEGMTVARARAGLMSLEALKGMRHKTSPGFRGRRDAPHSKHDGTPIPTSFDARTRWSNCPSIAAIRSQGHCGSCYAYATSSVFENRLCISRGLNVTLAPQFIVSCFKDQGGCANGFTDATLQDFATMGMVEESCIPYTATDSDCPSKCADGSPFRPYKSTMAYDLWVDHDRNATVERVQRDIMQNGPVTAEFQVFSDWYSYHSGVYRRTRGAKLFGGHAVRIIGWGEEAGVPYWLIANSHGTGYGLGGFFKMLRGVSESGIEDTIAGILP